MVVQDTPRRSEYLGCEVFSGLSVGGKCINSCEWEKTTYWGAFKSDQVSRVPSYQQCAYSEKPHSWRIKPREGNSRSVDTSKPGQHKVFASVRPHSYIFNFCASMSASTDRLIALFIAALFTGVYFCTFCSCIRWMVFTDDGWRIRKHIRKGILAATLAIAVFSTTHTVLAVTTSVAIVRQAESPTLSDAFATPNTKLPWESLVMVTSPAIGTLARNSLSNS